MTRLRAEIRDALDALHGRDPVLDDLIARHGPPPMRAPLRGDERFESLARSIAFQQLAGAAATTIWGRVVDALGGPGAVAPEAFIDVGFDRLRECGLSRAKAASMLDLSEHVLNGQLTLTHLGRRSDDEVIEQLTAVRGIGPWTAQMFLMFGLSRLDIWPAGDIGVAAGYAAAWGLEERPTPKEMPQLAGEFAPYRSIVACYCWAEIDTVTPEF